MTDARDRDRLATEAGGDRPDLDRLPTEALVALINAEDARVPALVAAASGRVGEVVDAVAARLAVGGRLRYVGAGSAGRVGAQDAAECPPTFGVDPDTVVAVVAGGRDAWDRPVEAAEDDSDAGRADLEAAGVRAGDVVVGISASGRTPYVLGALDHARATGALTVALVCAVGSDLAATCDHAIEVPTGPEVIAGSTRMKAATAQKLVLNTLSTAVMVRLGRTYGDLMVHVLADNAKLRRRAARIVEQATGAEPTRAVAALDQAGGEAAVAVVALLANCGIEQARARLVATGGRVRAAIEGYESEEG